MRKCFKSFNAKVISKKVHLNFYKSTPFFESKDRKKDLIISVYRKDNPKFEFGNDYMEFFNGLNYKKADIIFKGKLKASNNRKYEFVDTSVKIGMTYSYWISSDMGHKPVGPVSVKVRDQKVWWPYSKILSMMNRISRKYPSSTELRIFGKTSKNRDIYGIVAGNKKKCIALVGAIHAGESGPELVLPALERILKEKPDLLKKVGLAILPSVNIEERGKMVTGYPAYIRVNPNYVDINRNFDADWKKVDYGYGLVTTDPDSVTYRGICAESESETKAVVKLVRETKPHAVFSYHALACITGARFLASNSKKNKSFERKCRLLAAAYTGSMYPEEKTKVQLEYYSISGSFDHYMHLKYNTPCFDLEFDGREEGKASLTDKTSLKLLKKYQRYHYGGIIAVLEEIKGWHKHKKVKYQ